MIDICYKDLKRRTDFRFLAVHVCVIFITFLTNHGGSTSDRDEHRDEHRDSPRNTQHHLQIRYQFRPMDGGRLRWPVCPYSRHSGLRCRSIYRTPPSHMRKRHASCKPFHNPPDTLARILRHCDAIHACECSRDGRSMIWHAAAFSHTQIDREHASLGIMVEGWRIDEIDEW